MVITAAHETITLSPQSEVVAKKRYYLKEANGKTKENATSLFKRVAKAIASV